MYTDHPTQSATIDISWAQTDVIPLSGKYAIFNPQPVDSMHVDNTWWGSASPDTSSIFTYTAGYIQYSPFAGSPFDVGASKASVHEPNIFHVAMDHEVAGDFQNALNVYYDIISNDSNIAHKRMAIKSIVRVNEMYEQDFYKLRKVIKNELISAKQGY